MTLNSKIDKIQRNDTDIDMYYTASKRKADFQMLAWMKGQIFAREVMGISIYDEDQHILSKGMGITHNDEFTIHLEPAHILEYLLYDK